MIFQPTWLLKMMSCFVLYSFSTRTCGAPSNTSWNRWVSLFLKNINNIRHFAQVVQEPILCQFVWFVLATHGSIPWCLEWNCLFHGPNTFTLLSTRNSWSSHRPLLPYTTENEHDNGQFQPWMKMYFLSKMGDDPASHVNFPGCSIP